MKRYGHWTWLGVMLVLLGGCTDVPTQDARTSTGTWQAHVPSVVQGAHDGEGATVAAHLRDRYDDAVVDCRMNASDPNPLPAVLCSGVLLRATKRGAGFSAWNPNPNNPQPNGVSFSWLRKDNAFSELAFGYSNGFVILPHFFADSPGDGYTQLTVLCAFAFDGGTDARRSAENDGCGAVPNVANTGPCQAQGVTTSQAWLAKFSVVASRYWNQCGFTMKPRTPDAYLHFAQLAHIRNALASEAIGMQNEVKVGTWAQNDPHIPLEAFFYIKGNAGGLAEAKQNQADFVSAVGRWVPVIGMTLPAGLNAPASFTYSVADQAVP
ncbi:hypothetical protein [Luteibacter sp. E-22]|uniref:hypothetical protein n=1 Tax=Luteibacter sp. E-22 TaxID=3404050 RepID=UPI003CEDF23D